MVILCLGDSNTFGYDPRSYIPGRYPQNIRWTGRIQSPGRNVINCGQNGLCIPRINTFPMYGDLVRKYAPDMLVIMLGTNDLLNGNTAQDTGTRMEQFIDDLQTKTVSDVLLIAPPALQFGEWVQDQRIIDESKKLSIIYKVMADASGIKFADSGTWNIPLLFDGVHFTPEGHRVFAERLLELLT